MRDDELMREAKELSAPLELVRQIAKTGKLPVPNFSAGGIATPADAALVRRLGAEAVFVGSGIFQVQRSRGAGEGRSESSDPTSRMPTWCSKLTKSWAKPLRGLDVRQMEEKDMLSTRGW